jgi:hypothetical protein
VESGLAVRADDTIRTEEGDYTVKTYLDHYRPVDGAYFPFRMRHVERECFHDSPHANQE